MRSPKRRGISLGTITMLLLTAAVLGGYFMLMPTFTGSQDIRLNAAELAVAIDESFSQIAASTEQWIEHRTPPQTTAPFRPPQQILATAPPVVVTPPPKLSFSFCAAGSVVLNQTIQKALTVDDTYRFDILTEQLSGAMQADLSIATIENTYISSEKLTHLNLPVQALGALRSTGINALCVGYPNALNSGLDGLIETKAAVQNAGMLPYGLSSSQAEMEQTSMLNLNGVKVALLAYQNELSSTSRKQTTEEERSYILAPIELERIQTDISRAKASGAQVVLVSLCWGKAGAVAPTTEQMALAQAMADAGADIIIGTHSGTLQPVQILSANRGDGRYHPVLCAYSLGNLVTHDREKRVNLSSILLKAEVVYDTATGSIAFDHLSYTPTYAWRGKENGRTLYRILPNTGAEPPAFVDKDQKGVMSRCFQLVQDVMADTAITMAE